MMDDFEQLDETTEINTRPRPRRRVKSKVVIPPEGLNAKVIENIDGKRVSYEAEVIEENDNHDENTFEEFNDKAESEFSNLVDETEDETEIPESPRIPKTKLEIMFEQVRYAVEHNKMEDSFYAQVIRLPDPLTSFRIPCNATMDLGTFQFSARDYFKFKAKIQELNNRSGGIFNVRVYTINQVPLILYRRNGYATSEIEVGLLNYSVPDAPIEAIETVNNHGQAQDNVSRAMLDMMSKMSEMLVEMRRPKETSEIERFVMQKAVENMMNPPQNQSRTMEEILIPIMAAPAMIDGLSKKMFPETPLPSEPDTFDKISRALEHPGIQALGMRAFDVLGTIAAKTVPTNPAPAPAPIESQPTQEQQPTEETEMQLFIDDLLLELESDRPLDADNAYLKVLATDFPDYSEKVVSACKSFEFPMIQQLLFEFTKDIRPHPFEPFLDLEATAAANQAVYNERGKQMLLRLKEFYDFARRTETEVGEAEKDTKD